MKTRSGKHRPEASLWIWTSVAILLPSIFCAPVSQPPPPSDFYHALYQNSSSCSLLPRVSSDKESYAVIKINLLCNSSKDTSSIGVCQSLRSVVPQLCKLSSGEPSVATKISVSVDLVKVNSVGLQNFCGKMTEMFQNVSRSNPESWINPFPNGDKDKNACEGVCRNTPDKTLVGDEGMEVSPVCILLMEGYSIYQQALTSRATGASNVKVVPDEKNVPPPVPVSALVEGQGAKPVSPPAVGSSNDKVLISGTATLQNPEESTKSPLPSHLSEKASAVHNREGVHNEEASPKTAVQPPPPPKPEGNEVTNKSPSPNKVTEEDKKVNPDKRTEAAAVASGPSTENAELTPSMKSDVNVKVGSSSSGKPAGGALQGSSVSSSSSSSSSSTTSTSTPASVDTNNGGGLNDIPLPIASDADGSNNINNGKSSTSSAIPKDNAEKKSDKLEAVEGDKPQEGVKVSESPVKSTKDEKGKDLSSTKKVIDEDDGLAELAGDDDYNTSGEVDVGGAVANGKPSKSDVDTERGDIAGVEDTKNVGYEAEGNFNKPPTSQSQGSAASYRFGNAGLPYDTHGTTINVSLNEGEDTGFFNYFLFCATLVGVMYLVFHNKKKLIAYVVEGRRPRSRTRRPSANSQYRRLENNFD